MHIVHKTIRDNKHIQDQILREIEEEKIRKERNDLEEKIRKCTFNIEELEKQKKKIIKFHDDEDRRLHALLKKLDEEEAERLRLLNMW